MSAPVYEVAGAVDASAKDHVDDGDGEVVLVEQEDGEYLIAQPKPDNGGDS